MATKTRFLKAADNADPAKVIDTRFRVLRFDTRGHGRSGVTPGPYSVAQLGDDVIAQAHFRGQAMGANVRGTAGGQPPDP